MDLIFPKSCVTCKCRGSYICTTCLAKVAHGITRNNIVSLWKYQGVIKKAIWSLKYQFAFEVGNELGELASHEILNKGYFKDKKFLFTCIPLHTKRLRWRGFNQTEIIGKRIADTLHWQFDAVLLQRTKQPTTQVGHHKYERIRNIRGNFAVNNEAREKIKGKMIVIFDDVATTGATLTEAMKILKKAGAREVWGMSLAR